MDLHGGNITLGEIVRNPKARALVDREFPGVLNHPFAGRFMGMTLNQALGMVRGRVPQAGIDRLMAALKAL